MARARYPDDSKRAEFDAMVAFEAEQTVACACEDGLYGPCREGMGEAAKPAMRMAITTEGERASLGSLHRQPPPATTRSRRPMPARHIAFTVEGAACIVRECPALAPGGGGATAEAMVAREIFSSCLIARPGFDKFLVLPLFSGLLICYLSLINVGEFGNLHSGKHRL
jgi:hypothetical protein